MSIPRSNESYGECRNRLLGTPLSKRELDILRCIALGETNKQIGKSLGISEQTVKNHVTSIFYKLGAINRANASVIAIAKGYSIYNIVYDIKRIIPQEDIDAKR